MQRIFLFAVLYALVTSYECNAQLQIFLQQPPPGQLNISDLWQFQVMNSGETEYVVSLHATVSNDQDGIIFDGTSSVFEVSSMFSGFVAYNDIEPFTMAALNADYRDILLRTGTVPAGLYLICLELLDAETGMPLHEDCIEHDVMQSSPPVLLYPVDGTVVAEEFPVFSWIDPAPVIEGMSYRLTITERLADQTPDQALISNPPYFEYDAIGQNLFEYPLSARPLEYGKSYAWMVSGEINGFVMLTSEAGTFSRGSQDGRLQTIELTWPEEHAVLDAHEAVFCWRPLPGDDYLYTIYYSNSSCDPAVFSEDQPHPFAYLGAGDEARKTDSLVRVIENLTRPFWSGVCDRLNENIRVAKMNQQILADQQKQFETWAAEIECELTDPECHLPDCCLDYGCCADLDPADPEDRQEYRRRISCLTGPMRTMNQTLNDFTRDFEWLIDRWKRGEEHRNTMGSYDDAFGALEYLFSLEWMEDLEQEVFDALGITDLMEGIRNYVLSAICSGLDYTEEECKVFIQILNDVEQLLQDIQDGREKAEKAVEVFKALKSGGSLPIDVFLKLMENLYAAAGQATGTAVEGWENYWREMCSTLQRAYNLNRCMQQLNDMIVRLEEDCPAFCQQVLQELDQELAAANQELERIRQERHQQWRQDSTEFVRDLDQAVSAFLETPGFSHLCCQNTQPVNKVYTFPPYASDDPCKGILYGLLSQYLGDRLCYFNIRIEINCETREIKYDWETTKGFQRNENCCPAQEPEQAIGRTSGHPGEDEICWPADEQERESAEGKIAPAGAGYWRVEAEQNGRPVANSPRRRMITRPAGSKITPPDTIPLKAPPVKGCDCQVRVQVNGFALPPGVRMLIQAGSSLNLKVEGACTGTCLATRQSLEIQFPVLGFAGMNWILPPVQPAGNQLTFTFQDPGVYQVMGKQYCSDGSFCSAEALIEVRETTGPKSTRAQLQGDHNQGLTSDNCGNSPCMHPYFYADQVRLFIPDNRMDFSSAGDHRIGYVSNCFPDCDKNREVNWVISNPSGSQDVLSGMNLFEIKYAFTTPGIYKLCITESATCPDGTRQSSKYLLVSIPDN